MQTLNIPEKNVPILAEADVVVCGGGTAGVAAACSAARHGAEVLLLERWPSVGGMATNALVNIWHTSDREKQVIHGFVQELADRAGTWITRLDHYPTHPETHLFDPEGMRVVLHRTLDDCGVRTICNLTAVESIVVDGRIKAVLVDTKSGRKAVRGQVFIDATGDGDVAANAGLAFDYGRPEDGLVQGLTMMFCCGGIDETATLRGDNDAIEELMSRMKKAQAENNFPPFNEYAMRHYLGGGARNHGPYNLCPATADATDEEDLTQATVLSRERLHAYMDLWRREAPGYAEAYVEQTGFGIGVRESRRIRGLTTLDRRMVVDAVKQPDAIGHGFWLIDIHDPKGSGYTTWSAQDSRTMPAVGQSYHIPLGMCLNDSIPNLAVVGRCASSTHEGHASVRIQTHCMVMGQGTGTAAALALAGHVDMQQVDIRALQQVLRTDGVYLEDVPQ